VCRLRQMIRGRTVGRDGAEKRHLAGLETLITTIVSWSRQGRRSIERVLCDGRRRESSFIFLGELRNGSRLQDIFAYVR